MQYEINGHQIDVTDALRAHVQDKFQRIERHFDNMQSVHVVLEVDKLDHKAEATLNASGTRLHAEAACGDMYQAIDMMAQKLDRQVIKHKEKLKDHRRGGSPIKQMPT